MEFRLTYEGALFSTQRDPVNGQKDAKADHKQDIRRVFHRQLRRLWEVTPFLRRGMTSGPYEADIGAWKDGDVEPHTIEGLSSRYAMYGYNFIPLVTEDLNLNCGLDILFLRPDRPGSVLRSADIDNRLKTLFDALRIPQPNENLGGTKPTYDEVPFFVLLEDDSLITKVSVETDMLLQDIGSKSGINDARLVITVQLRPYEMHAGNLPFG